MANKVVSTDIDNFLSAADNPAARVSLGRGLAETLTPSANVVFDESMLGKIIDPSVPIEVQMIYPVPAAWLGGCFALQANSGDITITGYPLRNQAGGLINTITAADGLVIVEAANGNYHIVTQAATNTDVNTAIERDPATSRNALGVGIDVKASEYGAIADGTSRPVSQWLTGGTLDRGYADLAAIQVDYPSVTSLTDEIDWAAIQRALDEINGTTDEEFGGLINLSAGHYILNQTLTLKGPNVQLLGDGIRESWLEWTADVIGLRLAKAGAKWPMNPTLKDFTIRGRTQDDSTKQGFTTRTPLGGEGFWNVLYLTLEQLHIYGFSTALEVTNTPLLSCRNCSFTGINFSLDSYKIDSGSFLSCDINSIFYEWDGSTTLYPTCISVRLGSASLMTGDEVLAVTGPSFAVSFEACEFGHGGASIITDGGVATFRNSNFERQGAAPFCIEQSGASTLLLEQNRFEVFDGGTNEGFILQTPGASQNTQLIMRDNNLLHGDSYPDVIVRGDFYYYGRVDSEIDLEVVWQNASETELQRATDVSGKIRPTQFFNTLSDSDAGNALLRKGVYVKARSTALHEDHLTGYEHASGEHFRSSMLNDRLMRVAAQDVADTDSVVGTLQTAITLPVPAYTLIAEGDEIEIEFGGSFAANANVKSVAVVFTSYVLNPTATAWNDKGFQCRIRLIRRASGNVEYQSVLQIDGENPILECNRLLLTATAARDVLLRTTGTAVGDVRIRSAVVRYKKGISNQ